MVIDNNYITPVFQTIKHYALAFLLALSLGSGPLQAENHPDLLRPLELSEMKNVMLSKLDSNLNPNELSKALDQLYNKEPDIYAALSFLTRCEIAKIDPVKALDILPPKEKERFKEGISKLCAQAYASAYAKRHPKF